MIKYKIFVNDQDEASEVGKQLCIAGFDFGYKADVNHYFQTSSNVISVEVNCNADRRVSFSCKGRDMGKEESGAILLMGRDIIQNGAFDLDGASKSRFCSECGEKRRPKKAHYCHNCGSSLIKSNASGDSEPKRLKD